jgi:hypothetical protein
MILHDHQAAIQAAINTGVVSITLSCFVRPSTRAQREVTVSEVALDSNRFNYSVTSAVRLTRPTRQRQQATRFGMAVVIAPSSAAHPPICDSPCRSRATLLNLHGAFLARLLVPIL